MKPTKLSIHFHETALVGFVASSYTIEMYYYKQAQRLTQHPPFVVPPIATHRFDDFRCETAEMAGRVWPNVPVEPRIAIAVSHMDVALL